jgi:Cu(I)/Ag(I) efflux system membrane fusion protein
MKKFYAYLILILLVASFLAGSWYTRRIDVKANSSSGNPSLPVIVDKGSDIDPNSDTDIFSLPSGTVKISSEKQQLIGARISKVEKASLKHVIRMLGRVAADETRVYRINAAVDGWIQKTFDRATGGLVKKNEILATFYSPEFLGAEQAYIYALSSFDRFQASGKETKNQIDLTKLNIQQYKDSLRNLGMGDLQIDELARTRDYNENIYIASPVKGFILFRNVSPGERFEKGKELYRIADLGHVWILADIFENEAKYLQPGKVVTVSLPHQEKTFQAKVSDILPLFDAVTRTLKIRLETDNPDYILKPEMFVDIDLPIQLPPALTVPSDAILDSGFKKTVFIDRGNGFFEPREVETGWRLGNRVEVTEGLQPGERIVTSGTFLIDSESKLEMAAAGMQGTMSKDPVCGVEVSMRKAEKAGLKASHGGKTYYFHSEECKQKFDKDPDMYAVE